MTSEPKNSLKNSSTAVKRAKAHRKLVRLATKAQGVLTRKQAQKILKRAAKAHTKLVD